MMRPGCIDGRWLHRLNKFVGNYSQIIAYFRHGRTSMSNRLAWDAKFAELMEEGRELTAALGAAANADLEIKLLEDKRMRPDVNSLAKTAGYENNVAIPVMPDEA